jgi:hypothetical protein
MTTHGVFTFPSASTGDVDRFIYDSPVQTGATLPAASDQDQNICWAENRTPGRSADVGPDFGQGGGPDEGFLYSECSAPGANGDVYTLEFDTVLDAAAEQWQFNFFRMLRGPLADDNQTTMTVQISEDGGAFFDVSGELGGTANDVAAHDWGTEISIDLSEGGTNVDPITLVRIRWVSQTFDTTWHADGAVDTIEIVGTVSATVEQDNFRFEDDNGTESGSSFLAGQNVDVNRNLEDPFRVRQGGQASGDPDTQAATLQYKENGDAATEWDDV